jgi:hypothetical protein
MLMPASSSPVSAPSLSTTYRSRSEPLRGAAVGVGTEKDEPFHGDGFEDDVRESRQFRPYGFVHAPSLSPPNKSPLPPLTNLFPVAMLAAQENAMKGKGLFALLASGMWDILTGGSVQGAGRRFKTSSTWRPPSLYRRRLDLR